MDEQEQANEPEVKKPRRKKTSARWAILEEVPTEELTVAERSEQPVFRLVVDGFKSEKAAKAEGRENAALRGRVLLVCIHGDGQAEPRTQTDFSWK